MDTIRNGWRPAGIAAISLLSWISLAAVRQPACAHQGAPPALFSVDPGSRPLPDAVVLPPVDEGAFLAEDAARETSGIPGPLRFAAAIPVNISPRSDGTWLSADGGIRIWRLRIISLGARSLNLGLDQVRLPEGARLYLYAPGTASYDGPYTRGDVTPEGQIWTAVLSGDDAILELDLPPGEDRASPFSIIQVGHDYRGFGQILKENLRQGPCNNDVICPEGEPWRREIRSVGVYTIHGAWICSGSMLNSHDPTQPPYFLTAYHCGVNANNASGVVVYWRYESPNCGDLCCGLLTHHQSGCSVLAKYAISDFCLLRWNQLPAFDSDVYYSGWDATQNNAPSSAVGIHHPNCEEKAISFCNVPLSVTSYEGNSIPGDGSHWRIDHWDDGTTEVGSSGSGLWDPNHRLVGQLHGGLASCTSISSDWYGRFAVSWEGGGSTSSRLKDWLDPFNSGVQVLDGWDPNPPLAVEEPSEGGSRPFACSVTPNPASGAFRLDLDLPRPGLLASEILDPSGRVVRRMQAKGLPAGISRIPGTEWTPADRPLGPGLYLVRLRLDGEWIGGQKLLIVR